MANIEGMDLTLGCFSAAQETWFKSLSIRSQMSHLLVTCPHQQVTDSFLAG